MPHSLVFDHMFLLPLPILEKLLRPVIVYLVLVLLLRLFGKRELAQLNPFDLVVLLSLSNTVQNAIIGDDNSVTGGLIGAFSLLAINWLVVRVLFRSRKLTARSRAVRRCWSATARSTSAPSSASRSAARSCSPSFTARASRISTRSAAANWSPTARFTSRPSTPPPPTSATPNCLPASTLSLARSPRCARSLRETDSQRPPLPGRLTSNHSHSIVPGGFEVMS
jgi:hypothetical protein